MTRDNMKQTEETQSKSVLRRLSASKTQEKVSDSESVCPDLLKWVKPGQRLIKISDKWYCYSGCWLSRGCCNG
jgi:hypothetical protein